STSARRPGEPSWPASNRGRLSKSLGVRRPPSETTRAKSAAGTRSEPPPPPAQPLSASFTVTYYPEPPDAHRCPRRPHRDRPRRLRLRAAPHQLDQLVAPSE